METAIYETVETNERDDLENNQTNNIKNSRKICLILALFALVLVIAEVIAIAIEVTVNNNSENKDFDNPIESQLPTTHPTKHPSFPPPSHEPTSNPTLRPTHSPIHAIHSNNESFISVPDVIDITFPANFFSNDSIIYVFVLYDGIQVEIFDESTILHRSINIDNITDNQIHILVDNMLDISITNNVSNKSFTANINLPDDIIDQCPNDYGFEVFSAVQQGSNEEDSFQIYVLYESTYDTVAQTLFAELGAEIFTNGEASIIIACTPGGTNMHSRRRQLLKSSTQCDASSIQCPVQGGCTVTSPYSKSRTVMGVTRPHYGTDYRAATGTNILAAADGKVERSYLSKSYGETIVIRHSDGAATLYAHLSVRNKKVKDCVNAGDIIGKSGNTGRSTAPHLHFEYVPNGVIFKSKKRIDPHACIGTTASGSITVGDSGSAADDAFGIIIDGFPIGTTTIGAWNTLAVNNLLSGTHKLSLTVIVAPDDIGTYTVTLNNGWLFQDGTSSKSGRPPEGTIETWTIIVP